MKDETIEYIKNRGAVFVAEVIKEVDKEKSPPVKEDTTRSIMVLNEYERIAKTKATTPQELRIILNVCDDLRNELRRASFQ